MVQEHTYKQFDADLEGIRSRVLQMGGLVEEQITNAIEALISANLELAEQVINNDHHVNALEVGLDEDCTQIIARRQPTASDLRMVMTVVKTITDLERIGDEAAKIARMADAFMSRIASPSRASTRSNTCPAWCWKCCVERWTALRVWMSPVPPTSCARTCRWTRNSAWYCATSSLS